MYIHFKRGKVLDIIQIAGYILAVGCSFNNGSVVKLANTLT